MLWLTEKINVEFIGYEHSCKKEKKLPKYISGCEWNYEKEEYITLGTGKVKEELVFYYDLLTVEGVHVFSFPSRLETVM